MIQNYFKIAWRNLRRNKKHALLNMAGLGVALAACIVVFLVIQFEYSYNKHLKQYDNLHWIVTKSTDGAGENFSGGVPFPVVKLLRKDFPQYTFAEMMQYYGQQVMAKNTNAAISPRKFFETTGVFYGEPELMKLFETRFIRGNAESIRNVNTIALSKSTAEKYFGSVQEAMGQRVNFNNTPFDYEVTSVFEDMPENSDFPFKLVASYASFIAEFKNNWNMDTWNSNSSNHQVYALLPEGTNTDAFNRQLGRLEQKYNKRNAEGKRSNFLVPMANIHFDRRFETNGPYITSKSSLYTLSFIGLLIMLMACINFVNLSTALAVTRGKEVGIRKVMGSSRAQLRLQVFAETALVVGVAVLIAIGLASLALPYVKNIMDVQTRLTLFNAQSILFMVLITLVTIFLSGIYPAFVMGRFRPVEAIKNKINTMKVGSVSLRRVLVVLQFSFSQVLIIATIIAISQMNYIRNADLGLNKESVLLISINSDSASIAKQSVLKNRLLANPGIKQVSFGSDAPTSTNAWLSNFAFDEMKDRDFAIHLKYGDKNYLDAYGIKLVAGRMYGESDTVTGYIVNETLLSKVGVRDPQQAIGKMLRIGGWRPQPVVGVVRDFKSFSLKDVVPPTALSSRNESYNVVGIKMSGNNLLRTREEIEEIWSELFPDYVCNANFLDDNIENFYRQEQRQSLMYKVYALLAIFISCLGLYGLVSFMVVQKTKEVGIRKVLGASIGNILYLFSREFTILVTIAFLLAAPAAWYLMHSWLEDFEYRVTIGAGVFIVAIGLSILIAWLTVGYKSLKAALTNPVRSLRAE